MKRILYFLFIICSLFLQSCNDFLDVKPKGYTIPELVGDYERLLNSQDIQTVLDNYPIYITDDVLLCDEGAGGDMNGFEFRGISENERNLYTFQHGQVFTPGNNDGIWEGAYSNIFVYNAVINNVMSAVDGTEIAKKHLKGEALVGRAFEYLNLVNFYAKHYDAKTAASDYGVPIVLSEEVGSTATYVRNTVAEVYKRIEDDLTEAVGLLKEQVSNSYHPTKSIAYAFLSRVYLYKGEYKTALENANKALAINKDLIDYKLYKTQKGQWGRIVLESDESQAFPDESKSIENIYTRQFWNSNNLFKAIAASKDLLDTFASQLNENGEDMRLKLFFCDGQMDPGSGMQYFPGFQMYAPYINVCTGFSTPEIYLIAAECEARVGSITNALGHLNTLRDMRIKNNVHYENTQEKNREEVLKLVIDERRREFVFNGLFRLIDLKRLNREEWFAKTITHSADGETWTLPPNDPRYIMPVPENVLDYSPNMPQYDR